MADLDETYYVLKFGKPIDILSEEFYHNILFIENKYKCIQKFCNLILKKLKEFYPDDDASFNWISTMSMNIQKSNKIAPYRIRRLVEYFYYKITIDDPEFGLNELKYKLVSML